VVQMAKSQYDGLEYAIKFFISRAAFNAELPMYDSRGDTQGSSLAQFLPKVSFPSAFLENQCNISFSTEW
jgi:hypothetical protein